MFLTITLYSGRKMQKKKNEKHFPCLEWAMRNE